MQLRARRYWKRAREWDSVRKAVHNVTDEKVAATGVRDPSPRSSLEAVAAHALLQRLAWRPRLAGTVWEKEARNVCADRLRAQGFDVTEQPFEFSEFPGRWAPSIGAVAAAVTTFSSIHATVGHAMPITGLLILFGGVAIIALAGRWMARHGTSRFPWLRSNSVNLVATRGLGGLDRPRQWLVAHLDSKSQTVPMIVRIAGVALSALMMLLLAASTVAHAFVDGARAVGQLDLVITVIGWLTGVALVPVVLCIVGSKSSGALDNGSGVAAVLLAARKIDNRRPLGILFTSGEELGLAGARAYVAANPRGGIALNCDTCDDHGRFIGMMHGSPYKSELAQALTRASEKLGVPVRVGAMLPGVLADNIAFTDAGWDSLTLSRGNLGTLSRVHTAGDRPDKLDGSGIAEAARLLAATIEELP